MCGISGIIYSTRSGRSVDPMVLTRMRETLHHRGPDEAGIFVDKNVGLAHRRLSIIDVGKGQQPMFNSDRTSVITYNGEIYNHVDLRRELTDLGHSCVTHCDTETILHLYDEFGTDCVSKLRGMFAFGIWNAGKKELLLVRDRLGVKPLYYVHDADGSIFFASEIKALLAANAVKAELNYNALPDQLANQGTTGDETLFVGVKRLAPGHFLLWKDGSIKTEKYWDVEFEPKYDERSDADLVEEWLELFRKSVELRLMSDVPLGMFLSGGIDSSAIAALMSEMTDQPIKTFSVGFREAGANEFEFARTASKAFGTDHHEIIVTPDEYFAELPKLIWHEDEPIGFDASVPLYFVSKLAEKHVKVVLTGEGCDEILGGYARYAKTLALLNYGEKYESYTPKFLRSAVRSGVNTLPVSLNRKLKRTFLALDANIEDIYFDNFSIFGKAMQSQMLTNETKDRIDVLNPYVHLQKLIRQTDAEDLLDKLLYADSRTYLHELLMKQDQMSMAASVESRVPFLDHKLVEYTARLPGRMKIRGSTTKWILREAMKGILPPEIVYRPKLGFPVPMEGWLRGEFGSIVDEYVLSERTLERNLFDADFVRQIVAAHRSGEDHTARLFRLINIEIWNRQFIDGEELD